MEKNLKYGTYLQVYGDLLTERQRDIIELYYDYDLSLAEISENLSISRQAVLDALKNACSSLDEYERVLHVCEDKQKVKTLIEDVEVQLKNKDLQQIDVLLQRIKTIL